MGATPDPPSLTRQAFACAHLVITAWVLNAEAAACQSEGWVNYAITCLAGRFGWVPFVERFRGTTHHVNTTTVSAAKKSRQRRCWPRICKRATVVPIDQGGVAPIAPTYAFGRMSTKLLLGGHFALPFEFSSATVTALCEALSSVDHEPDERRRTTIELGNTVDLLSLYDVLKIHRALEGKINLVMGQCKCWHALPG